MIIMLRTASRDCAPGRVSHERERGFLPVPGGVMGAIRVTGCQAMKRHSLGAVTQ
jgi:hypothetical protein